MKRWSREYASHVVDRLRRESQRLLPSALRTIPQSAVPNARDVVNAEKFVPVDPDHLITRRLPHTIFATMDWEFASRRTFQSPGTFTVQLERGRALRHAVMTSHGTLLGDLSIEPGVVPANVRDHSSLSLRALPALQYVSGNVALLTAYGGDDNYFHWMFDIIPRLEILDRAGYSTDAIRVAVNDTRTRFQQETLRHFGIANIVNMRHSPYIAAEHLIVPSLPGVMGDVTARSCRFLRDQFRTEVASSRRRRLFISRAGARHRRLLNETDVMQLLSRMGFESVSLDGMRVRDQATLFASAECVVGTHGAGLTNIVFCDVGTAVIELFSPTYVNGCYWGIANHAGLEYWYILGEGHRPEADESHAGAADDLRVDIGVLRETLARAHIS